MCIYIKNFLLLPLSIFIVALLYSTVANSDEIKKTSLKNGWNVEIKLAGEKDCFICDSSELNIYKDNRRMYNQKFDSGHTYIKPFEEGLFEKDITQSGSNSIWITYYTGGAHCCSEITIFSLGRTVRKIAEINAMDGGNEPTEILKDIDGNGTYELSLTDTKFRYWQTSFAESAFEEVKLEYQDGSYKLSAKMMKKAETNKDQLGEKALNINNSLKELKNKGFDINKWKEDSFGPDDEPNQLPPELWQVMLDLLYTGNGELALEFLDKAWYKELNGKNIFFDSFKKQLESSPYIAIIRELNPSFFNDGKFE